MDKMKNIPFWTVTTMLTGWLFFSVYSFSQVDLNLTLSTNSFYLSFQQLMLQIGYFQRPFSTAIFCILILLLTSTYIFLVFYLQKKSNSFPLLRLIFMVYAIVLFAYPAFSYDIFNYIFDARIVTTHHLSPYYFRALDFPDDSWTRFMRWTHRYYPYGPLWLILSIIPSYLGQGKFIITLFLFKLLFFLGATINVLLVRAIALQINRRQAAAAIAFFALNPLVINESILSPHNDVYLLSFALLGLYFMLKKRPLLSVGTLGVSIGIKFLTVIFLPFFLLKWWKQASMSNSTLIISMLLSFIVFLIPIIYLREAYPWYFVPVLALGAFLIHRRFIAVTMYGLTLGEMLRYAPVLWYGHFNYPVSSINLWVTVGCIVLAMIIGALPKKQYRS